MIIDFSNINGGGGSGYTLPVASSEVLGGVMIGSGITVDSAGTISVTGGTGSGIEVVTSLPASGTDGQMVLLETINNQTIIISDARGNSDNISVTATNVTSKTFLYKYEWYGQYISVFVNPDNSVTLESTNSAGTEFNYSVGTVDGTLDIGSGNGLIVNVTETGFTIASSLGIAKQDFISNIRPEEKQVLYTWSDFPELTADIDHTSGDWDGYWCLRFKYSELPENTSLAVTKYRLGNYYHWVYSNNELRVYESASADTYTATTYKTVGKYGLENKGRAMVYWTDDEIVLYYYSWGWLNSINYDAFYKTGWHKYIGHRISNKAFYKDYVWYDEDYNILIKDNSYPMYDVEFKVNGSGSRVYSKNNSSLPTIFAPTTSATTGYVCVAGNGNSAPTWVSPETITNGVKFWKGTQAEYDALSGTTGYDSSTLYIITDNGNNAV